MEEIERQIMTMLLAGDYPPLVVLRTQYGRATVVDREFTGVGVFTVFSVPVDAPRTDPANLTLGDVAFELEGTEHGGGVVLFVRNGVLKTLELFNYTDDWPQVPALRAITYMAVSRWLPRGGKELVPTAERDLAALEQQLAGPLS